MSIVNANPRPVGPPTKHQLAVMIWLAVFAASGARAHASAIRQ
jgi:hypothetical protein